MSPITKIGEAILAVLAAWVPGATIVENVLNVLGAFTSQAKALGVNVASPLVQDVMKAEASVTAINNGDVAILGVVPFEGKSIAVFAIDNNSLLAHKLFGT